MSQAHGCHASNYRQLAVGFAYAATVSHGASVVPKWVHLGWHGPVSRR